MKGLEEVRDQLSKVRFRVSRLIDLERMPEGLGKVLLEELIDAGELVKTIEKETSGREVIRI